MSTKWPRLLLRRCGGRGDRRIFRAKSAKSRKAVEAAFPCSNVVYLDHGACFCTPSVTPRLTAVQEYKIGPGSGEEVHLSRLCGPLRPSREISLRPPLPQQAALSGLYEEVERRGQADALATRRDRIDGGIDRISRFVREVAQTADLTTRAELHPVKGPSDRFVLALRNLLRNVAQSRTEPPVQIRVTGGVNNGAEGFVRVDDDGPGVPSARPGSGPAGAG